MNHLILVVVFSFISNFIWENLHARLYVQHLGKAITEKTLFVATLGDVIILGLFALLWYFVPYFHKNIWVVIPLGLAVAYWIEKYALFTNRWSYAESMPIIPYLEIGLSPFLQLACTGFLLLLILKYYS